jgi:flagellar basal-body rod modification protein FlgD
MSNVSSTTGSGTNSGIKVVERGQTGFAGLTSNDFLRMLIEQLKHQDPTQPTSNEQILQQLSYMRSLQADTEMTTAIRSLTTSNGLSGGASFLGRQVQGTDASGQTVSGLVERASLQGGSLVLQVGGKEIRLSDVTSVALPG